MNDMNWQQLWSDAQDLQVLFKPHGWGWGSECLIRSWGAIGNWKSLGNGDSIFSVWPLNEAIHGLVDYTYTYKEKHYSQPWSEKLLLAVDHGWMQRLLIALGAKNMLYCSALSIDIVSMDWQWLQLSLMGFNKTRSGHQHSVMDASLTLPFSTAWKDTPHCLSTRLQQIVHTHVHTDGPV